MIVLAVTLSFGIARRRFAFSEGGTRDRSSERQKNPTAFLPLSRENAVLFLGQTQVSRGLLAIPRFVFVVNSSSRHCSCNRFPSLPARVVFAASHFLLRSYFTAGFPISLFSVVQNKSYMYPLHSVPSGLVIVILAKQKTSSAGAAPQHVAIKASEPHRCDDSGGPQTVLAYNRVLILSPVLKDLPVKRTKT